MTAQSEKKAEVKHIATVWEHCTTAFSLNFAALAFYFKGKRGSVVFITSVLTVVFSEQAFRNVETSSYVTLKSPGISSKINFFKGHELKSQSSR